jgi:hypothetical protein
MTQSTFAQAFRSILDEMIGDFGGTRSMPPPPLPPALLPIAIARATAQAPDPLLVAYAQAHRATGTITAPAGGSEHLAASAGWFGWTRAS